MDVLERRGVVSEGQQGEVGGSTRSKAPGLGLQAQDLGRSECDRSKDVRFGHAGGQQLGHRPRQIVLRCAVDVAFVLVGGDRVGSEALGECRFQLAEVQRRHAMAHVKQHSLLASGLHLGPHTTSGNDPVRFASEGVGDHIAGPEQLELLGKRPVFIFSQTEKQGPICGTRGFEGQVQRHTWVAGTRRGAAAVDGDSPDQGAAVGDRLHTRVDVEPVEVIQAGTIGALAVTRDADRHADSSS